MRSLVPLGLPCQLASPLVRAHLGVVLERVVVGAVEERELGLVLCNS